MNAGPGADHEREARRRREEVHALRARARVHALVAEAQGLLRERYGLPDADSAFTLLRLASQRHNVKMRVLAEALLAAPRPAARTGLWFPGRTRTPQPPLTCPEARRVGTSNRGGVLTALLGQTLAVAGAGMGDVQLVDPVRGGLRIEAHTGLTPAFVEFFAHVGEPGTSCARAAREVTQVTVPDVNASEAFTEDARQAILAAGSRACHSVPLTGAPGRCVGMVSVHFTRELDGFDPERAAVLEAVGAQTGRWLAWHERTVVLDALEHLHALAAEA